MATMELLLVEDDHALREALTRAFELDGYAVTATPSGLEALKLLNGPGADVVVLDLGLPDLDGLEVCRRLRASGDKRPVLMLTARDAVDDRVAGLDAGADDYLVKPFALDELHARVRALLRRTGADRHEILRFEDLVLDPQTREVRRGERSIELTRTEFSLLEYFLQHPRIVLTRSQIFEAVWGYDFGLTSNSLEVYVGYLRRKLEAEGEPRLIHTARGVGYTLRA